MTTKPKLTRADIGHLGGVARHTKSQAELNEINQKIVATRKANNPNAFREMGTKGGQLSRGGGRKKRLSESQMKILLDYLAAGKTQRQAASQFSLGLNTVNRYVKAAKLNKN